MSSENKSRKAILFDHPNRKEPDSEFDIERVQRAYDFVCHGGAIRTENAHSVYWHFVEDGEVKTRMYSDHSRGEFDKGRTAELSLRHQIRLSRDTDWIQVEKSPVGRNDVSLDAGREVLA